MYKETYLYLRASIKTSNSSLSLPRQRFPFFHEQKRRAAALSLALSRLSSARMPTLSRRLPRLVPLHFNPAYYFARPFRRRILRDSTLVRVDFDRRERGRGSVESYQGFFHRKPRCFDPRNSLCSSWVSIDSIGFSNHYRLFSWLIGVRAICCWVMN